MFRCARFAVCAADPSEYEGQWLPPEFRGNVMKIHGTVDEKKLDIWQFSNKEEVDPDKTEFVHCTVDDASHRGKDPAKALGKNLYLFMELVSTIRVDKEDYHTLSAQMKASKSEMTDAAKRDREERKRQEMERERALLKKKKSHVDGDIRFSENKSLLRRPKKRGEADKPQGNPKAADSDDDDAAEKAAEEEAKMKAAEEEEAARKKAEEEENDVWADEDYMTVEMSAGWVMIPIADTVAKAGGRGTTKITLDMCGGTPFSVVGIQKGDVPRRAGLLEMVKRIVGIKIHSKLELLISTVPRTDRTLLLPLPRNIILPEMSVSIVGVYRHFLANTLREYDLNCQIDRILPQTGELPTGDPLFSSFPRILNDPAASRVLLLLWRMEAPKNISVILNAPPAVLYASTAAARGPGNAVPARPPNGTEPPVPVPHIGTAFATPSRYTIPARTLEVFRSVVLRLWRAMASPDTRPPRVTTSEPVKSIYRRELKLRALLGIKKTPSVLATTAHINALKENEKNNKLQASQDLRASRGSNLGGVSATALAEQDMSVMHIASTPFNVRELLWGGETYL